MTILKCSQCLLLYVQTTQQMQIPLSFADAVIGTAGASISYIRRASGATVTIQETRGVPGEMTVEMSGTASQVQAAQQLIQAIIFSGRFDFASSYNEDLRYDANFQLKVLLVHLSFFRSFFLSDCLA